MGNRRFLILDVFAERRLTGNQLAVVLDSVGLSDDEMQRLAREMHFSETTFLLSDQERDGGFDVRIFTPEAEVPFAGHPTLGTAYAIREVVKSGAGERIGLNLGDIVEEDGSLYGDGVIVAARLESLATPGGITLSGAVYEQVKQKVSFGFQYNGDRKVKNSRSRLLPTRW